MILSRWRNLRSCATPFLAAGLATSLDSLLQRTLSKAIVRRSIKAELPRRVSGCISLQGQHTL
jgi:hypothetical protein